MDAALARLRALDPRVRIGAAVVAVLRRGGGILADGPQQNIATPPAAVASPTPEPPATPARVRSTPFGTPGPRPATFVGVADSIDVSPPPAPRSSPPP